MRRWTMKMASLSLCCAEDAYLIVYLHATVDLAKTTLQMSRSLRARPKSQAEIHL